jgi:hypothetical protein
MNTFALQPSNIGDTHNNLRTKPSGVLPDGQSFDVTYIALILVDISPLNATIYVGQSVTFNSTVTGGIPPYTGQWVLNGNPVPGANQTSWTFTSPTDGIYYVWKGVTDNSGTMTLVVSATARIVVTSVPVGGYSFSVEGYATAKPLTPYLALIAILTIGFTVIRRKTPRKTR